MSNNNNPIDELGDGSELSLADRGLTEIPQSVQAKFAHTAHKIDLTNNKFKSGSSLLPFSTRLSTLVLDKNQLSSFSDFPQMNHLNTLWVNNNNLVDINTIVDQLASLFPSLQYLSMLKNPACPDMYTDDSQSEPYQRYRYYLIHRLPSLQFLDALPISPQERSEADVRGQYMKVSKPSNHAESASDSKPRRQNSSVGVGAAGSRPPKVATYLAKGKPRYDGTNSEGNRFICNDDL